MSKSIKSLLCSIAGVLCATTMLVACAGDDSSLGHDTRIEGTWVTRSIASTNPVNPEENCQPDGATIPLGEGDNESCGPNDRITFNSNGTWTTTTGGSGTWTTNGSTLVLGDMDSLTQNLSYTVTNNSLTLTGRPADGGVILTLGRILG